jgi:hypothetical protein
MYDYEESTQSSPSHVFKSDHSALQMLVNHPPIDDVSGG